MPIDSSIIGRLLPPKPIVQDDSMERYGKAVALKGLISKGEQEERLLADDTAVRDAYRQSGGDNTRLRALLRDGGHYTQLQALEKAELEKRAKEATIGKDEAAAGKSKFDVAIKEVEHGSAILQAAKDNPQAWPSIRRVFALQFPKLAADLPEQFDPAFIDGKIAAGQTITQKLQDQRERERIAETGRHNKEQEGNAAGQLAVSRGNLGVAQGNLGVSRDRLNFDREQPKGVLNSEGTMLVDPRTAEARPVTVSGQPVPGRLTEGQRKELSSIESQKSQVAGALKAVEGTPSAFGLARGAATMAGAIPESVAGRMDSNPERQARSYVFNVVSKVINERAGAAQSAQELARLRSFLPAETDNADQIKSKLTGFQTYLDDSRAGYDTPQQAAAPRPKAEAGQQKVFSSMPDPAQYSGRRVQAPDGGVYKSNGKNWVRER